MKSDLVEKDKKYLWHPYTQMKDYEKDGHVLLERAEGIRLYDNQGRVFLDTISSWWCNIHGHNHPAIKKALKEQMESLDHVMFAGFTHEKAIVLAEKLVDISPSNMTKVFYSDNGSTACEVALKISYQYWKNIGMDRKEKFISLELGYHGDTIGAMSVGGIPLFQEKFAGLLFPAWKAPSPYCYRCRFGKEKNNCSLECISPLEEMLREKSGEIAGIILEPLLQAAGGMIVYPVEYLRKVAALSRTYRVHLILDEVATGFGRTGKMFALEHAGIEPDFLCVSKGLTGGTLPLAATLTTDEIYRAFYNDSAKDKTFYHGHTYTGNPLATAVAVASLQIFEDEKVLERISRLIPHFHRELEKFKSLPIVGDVRCLGMVGALEIVRDKKTKSLFPAEDRMGWKIYQEGLKAGLILRPLGPIVYFFLPLCIKQEEISDVLERTYKILSRL